MASAAKVALLVFKEEIQTRSTSQTHNHTYPTAQDKVTEESVGSLPPEAGAFRFFTLLLSQKITQDQNISYSERHD